jgi:uncharacterized membrane protein
MKSSRRDKTVHVLFDISVISKGVDGMLEIVGGAVLLLVGPAHISRMIRLLTQHELVKDPHDLLASFLVNAATHLSASTQAFGALYLLWHGVIKVALVVALLRKLLWAYPAAILAFGLFFMLQLYRYSHTHSVWLLALSVVDLFVIAMTWLEYKRLQASGTFD